LFVVVSNNSRNRNLPSVLGARLTTSVKPSLPSIVELPAHEVVTGQVVVCDDIVELWEDEVIATLGALSVRTMDGVDRGLAAALALPGS
jgi:mRNA interferase MazF